jgi:2-C-methyl-D-erythritol 4-phosphate cytidylyltransferase
LPRDVGVVVVAAGEGRRFGGSVRKVYRELCGVPLLLYAVRPFAAHPDVAHVTVVLSSEDAATPPEWLSSVMGSNLTVVAGGAERSDSVAAGLAALPESCSIVLVHDGARPLAGRAVIDAVIRQARAGVGAVAAVALRDTLKRTDPDSNPPRIQETIPRQHLWRAQTPQGFPRAMLTEAYRRAGAGSPRVTDEASLVEATGAPVVIVPDSSSNIKVTTPDDLKLAEGLIKAGTAG